MLRREAHDLAHHKEGEQLAQIRADALETLALSRDEMEAARREAVLAQFDGLL